MPQIVKTDINISGKYLKPCNWILLLFVVFFPYSACENQKPAGNNLFKKSRLILKQRFDARGQLREKYHVKKDSLGHEIKEGLYTSWGEDGLRSYQAFYKDGEQVGTDTQWGYRGQIAYTYTRYPELHKYHRIEWYENGPMKQDAWLCNDKEEGVVTWWYRNKQKEYEGICKNGRKEGRWTVWYPNGQKHQEGFFKNGYLEGATFAWYEGGQKLGVMHCASLRDPGLSALWSYVIGNEEKPLPSVSVCTEIDGPLILWYANGEKSIECLYRSGLLDSLYVSWYPNGTKKSEVFYNKGKKNGIETEWFSNGQKRQETAFDYGKKNGLRMKWYSTGQKKEVCTFNNDKLTGQFNSWHDNGRKRVECFYVDGLRNGYYTEWNSEGDTIKAYFSRK